VTDRCEAGADLEIRLTVAITIAVANPAGHPDVTVVPAGVPTIGSVTGTVLVREAVEIVEAV
jgi:hypothetical protein